MNVTVAIGSQYGDEGKGKIVDYLAAEASAAVRFNGGNNAGHSVVINGERHAVHLLPAAAYRPGMLLYLTPGVVFDPAVLIAEIYSVRDVTGVFPSLIVDRRCHMIGRTHRKKDAEQEEARKGSGTEIGTTRRGNGPCYADKALRCGYRLEDLESLEDKYIDYEYNLNAEGANFLLGFAGDTASAIQINREEGMGVLFCGAHGTLLDINHGTYPYVTSSDCVAGAACTGGGLPPRAVDTVVGITKSYMTRIGTGPFLSEIEDEVLASEIRETGKEYGTTTGRPRRIGWLDLEALRYADMLNGFSYIALTMLDVLSGFPQVLVRLPGGKWKSMLGWTEDISEVRSLEGLPLNARAYIHIIEENVGVRVGLISVGPDRSQIIDCRWSSGH
jgi:adenylosuccinate synthase